MTQQNTETNTADGDPRASGRRPRSIVAAGLALGLVAGAGASLAVGWPFAAGASTQGSTSEVAQEAEGRDGSPSHDDEVGRQGVMYEVLQSLVDDGTLTREQLDAIVAALRNAHDMRNDGPKGDQDGRRGRGDADSGRHGPGHHGPGRHERGIGRGPGRELMDTAATFLGLDAQELRSELKSGKTLAEIAEAQGKSRQDLIDALVSAGIDAATERLNERIPRLVDGDIGPRHDS